MAPAVPFALLGVVQLTAVAAWLGLAGAASFPRLRRRVTALFVLGAIAMAVADALTAVRYGMVSSDGVGWLRVAGLLLLGLGATRGSGQSLVVPSAAGAGAVVVPLGAAPEPAFVAGAIGVLGGVGAWLRGRRPGADRWLGLLLGIGLAFSGVSAALAEPARDSTNAALAVLAARAMATLALVVALVLLARLLLVGKIVGAMLAGVVAMAVGAVGVVGTGVASEVQSEQSQRLLQVATSEAKNLDALASRATLFAQVVAQCPNRALLDRCITFLKLFSDQPDYFGVVVRRGKGAAVVAPDKTALSNAALVQLAGSSIVQEVLKAGTTAQTAPSGPIILAGPPSRLAVVAAVAGRRDNSKDSRVRPTFAAVYGIFVGDRYLSSSLRPPGYDESIIADGQVLSSSLDAAGRRAVLSETREAAVENADPSVTRVVPATSDRPTVALVPVTALDNDDVRIATLALSQDANDALSAQRGVLRRLFVTALIALIAVALLAIALAQRIADPVRRLTVAAGLVRRGDLDTSTTVTSKDEVGRLSRAFDAMTSSLRTLTADLRATAAEQTALRARLETVVSSMNDGLIVTDGGWVVTSANPTAARILEQSEEDLVGKPLADVLRVEDAEGRSLLRKSATQNFDGELAREPGNRLPVRVAITPLAEGEGRVVVVGDRTREYEIERMKTEFLANISHELRTPLTPIRGYAEMLARRPELTRAQVETFLDEILNSTGRMSRAVELLVDVAALESGRVVPQHSRISVRSFVDERVETWKTRYPERAGDFKRRVATKLPPLDIDRHWVGRALDEFADNAVKYTTPGTAITVVASVPDANGGGVRVAVKDAGPGFDPKRAAELLGDFSQADASETRRVGGLGLGLGFVNRVVERFGLEITIETQPGKGSEFALLLPSADSVGS